MSQGMARRRRANNNSTISENENLNSSGSLSDDQAKKKSQSLESNNPSSKVACDPRDLTNKNDKSVQPQLTLLEEILLLGLKDKKGYLSFWNDNISYALRGCILIELALRGKVQIISDPNRRNKPLMDLFVEVIDDTVMEEAVLDEAIKLMKNSRKMSVEMWIDLMSGETWNITKIGYQLKQVRERIAKGLVDKGILRTEKTNFLIFDMATHPIANMAAKDDIRKRIISFLTSESVILTGSKYFPECISFRYFRTICLLCSAYASNVLENALEDLSHIAQENAFQKVESIMSGFSQWPFDFKSVSNDISTNLRRECSDSSIDLRLEVIAAVFEVFQRSDSII